MKKSGIVGSSIFAMWEKASKARKTDELSTPNQTVAASSTCTSPVHFESNLQLVLWQEPESRGETSTPHVEDDESIDEDDEPMQADLEALEHDPGKRIPISVYAVNDQDRVTRRYIEMGSCQPKNHKFKFTNKSGKERRFCRAWFKEFPWIEYSVGKEAAFCFVCYLFKDKTRCPGGDAFVKKGFNNWNMKSRLKKHEGEVCSAHAELNGRFDEVNMELLSCMEAFCPLHLFAAYDQEKLVRLATKFYASDFKSDELARLPWQLNMYVTNVRRDERFQNLKNLCQLSVMLVETNKHEQYHIVYKLLKLVLKLVLILPVATASVERVFSSMSHVKNKLRNKMGDEYLNNCLVTFVEREFFNQVKDEDVINLFQKGDRRVIL